MAMTEAKSENDSIATLTNLVFSKSYSYGDNGAVTSGFARLLACCGVTRKPTDLMATTCSTTGSSSGIESNKSAGSCNFDAAAEKLLSSKRDLPHGASRSFTKVEHIRQSETWDCGIACLMMVFRWLRDPKTTPSSVNSTTTPCISKPLSPVETIERNLHLQKVGTQSIWTVDLAMLLERTLQESDNTDDNHHNHDPNHSNTRYLFASQVLGANLAHSTAGYYETAFAADSVRVQRICDDMIRLQLPILCPFDMEFHQLISLISCDHCIAIVLVDNSILMRSTTTHAHSINTNDNTQDCVYMGHYVIVTGISRDPDHLVAAAYNEDESASALYENDDDEEQDRYCIVIVNPGVADPVTFVTPRKFEAAWIADGTDRDVLFVAKHHAADVA